MWVTGNFSISGNSIKIALFFSPKVEISSPSGRPKHWILPGSQPHVLLQEMADPWHECIGYAVTLARQDGEVVHEAVRNEINAMIKSSPVDLVTATGFPGDSNGSLPANSGTQLWLLGWEDALEEEMTIYSRILAWNIPWTEEPSRLQSMWLQRVRHDWATNTNIHWS